LPENQLLDLPVLFHHLIVERLILLPDCSVKGRGLAQKSDGKVGI